MLARASSQSNLREWSTQLSSICGDFDTTLNPRHSLFIGDVSGADIGGLAFAKVRTNAARLSHGVGGFDDSSGARCFLIYQKSGRQHILQGERTIELMAGDLALVDGALPFAIEPHGLIENTSIHLSRTEALRYLPAARLFAKLARHSAAARLIRSLITCVHDTELKGCAAWQEGAAFQNALLALLAPAIGQGVDEQWSGVLMEDGDVQSLAVQLIEQSLQDSDLTPTMIAEKLHVSIRRLYRLFEDQGDSVCRFILRRRLEHVAQELRNPGARSTSITQIAFKWGFVEAAHFSRSFKRQFGLSPRDYRAISLAREVASIDRVVGGVDETAFVTA